ncbi:MAG: sodium/solute symporter [Verrucomicrobiota bacterium]
MNLVIELTLFAVFVITVIGLGVYQGNKKKDDEESGSSGYFLAGRGLTWWLVGFSLIAANISTEQFVGMSGAAAGQIGLGIASYEWMAAITLVGVAFVFLPTLLKAGIFTIPEFLEYRFDPITRLAMAALTLAILVLVPASTVIFAGAKFISGYYEGTFLLGNLIACCWLIAVLAAAYVFIGGLKSCAWTDLVWGSALIIAGAFITYLAFTYLQNAAPEDLKSASSIPVSSQELAEANAFKRLSLLNAGSAAEGGKLHMVRPLDDPDIPWTALILGLWIPNFFYWGLNQYIMQRTLGSKSLAEGQIGIVFAAFLKLIIPFVVVIPGILAFNLFSEQLLNADGTYDYDGAFPILVRELVSDKVWISWFVLAALFGAIVSSLASMLNSASTVATIDLYQKVKPKATDKELIQVGRFFVVLFVIVAALTAPALANPNFGGVFTFIQEFQGFISPGVLAVFLFGLLSRKTPRFFGWLGIVTNAVLYALLKWVIGPFLCDQGWWYAEEIAFLDRMGICFLTIVGIGFLSTWLAPLAEPVKLPENQNIDLKLSGLAKWAGIGVILLTISLYILFW